MNDSCVKCNIGATLHYYVESVSKQYALLTYHGIRKRKDSEIPLLTIKIPISPEMKMFKIKMAIRQQNH